jgi:hypothetical protein
MDVATDIFSEHNAGSAANEAVLNAFFLVGGFLCDIGFIAVTRRLIRWAREMTQPLRVVAVVALNCLLAAVLVGPMLSLASATIVINFPSWLSWFVSISESNVLDALLALLFVFLALILLVHRAIWPLLTRTLFRMQDIGTKGRRGILVTVGLALLGWSGAKLPELVKELAKTLGKG